MLYKSTGHLLVAKLFEFDSKESVHVWHPGEVGELSTDKAHLAGLTGSVIVLDPAAGAIEPLGSTVASMAKEHPQHKFVVLAPSRKLHAAFSGCKALTANLWLGSELGERGSPDNDLPWLLDIMGVSRFIVITSLPDKEFEIDNLKPCANEVPFLGDPNPLDGVVYQTGSYVYRDSVNAPIGHTGKLHYVAIAMPVLDLSDRGVMDRLDDIAGKVLDGSVSCRFVSDEGYDDGKKLERWLNLLEAYDTPTAFQ